MLLNRTNLHFVKWSILANFGAENKTLTIKKPTIMKKIALFFAGTLFAGISLVNAQNPGGLPSPIEVIDLGQSVQLIQAGESADQAALNKLMSRTYTVAGTFDAKYNAANGTFTQRLPTRVGDKFILETEDTHFDMTTPRGAFTTTKIDAAQAKEISSTPSTLILEVRPTGQVKNGKMVFAPVSVAFRGMVSGEDVYLYKVGQ